jgi:uncharacterized delta-60 repeat protein
LDTTFKPAIRNDLNDPIRQVVLQSDRRILLLSSHLSRLNPDGSSDASFRPLEEMAPTRFAVQADGKILVGGQSAGGLTWFDGQSPAMVVRLNADGSIDPNFFPPLTGASSWQINDIAVQNDGKILLGTAYGASLIRLNSDGTWDGNFEADLSGMWGVVAVALDQNGNVLVSAQLSRQPLTLSRRFGGEPAPTAPIFERQPLQWPLSGGNAVALAPLITAFPLPSYQWEFNGENLPGATHSVLVVTNRPTSAGSYQLRVSNSLGSVVSDPVMIGAPIIVAQPSSQAALPTQQVEFSVTATSVLPLFYQWQFNGQELPGQTNSTLVLADVQPPQVGIYTVIVSILCAVIG